MGVVPYTILIIHYIIQLKRARIADKIPKYWLKDSFWKENVDHMACCPILLMLGLGNGNGKDKKG
jgi:hypothetical protein